MYVRARACILCAVYLLGGRGAYFREDTIHIKV